MKLKILYLESRIIYGLTRLASFVFYRLSDKHHKIYLKIMELEGKE